jgi:hypothetical protein
VEVTIRPRGRPRERRATGAFLETAFRQLESK